MSRLDPHSDIINTFNKEDVVKCIQSLRELKETKEELTSKVSESIIRMFNRFSTETFIPIEYAEAIMLLVSDLLEKGHQDEFPPELFFASSKVFVDSLVNVFKDFKLKDSMASPITHVFSSYQSIIYHE